MYYIYGQSGPSLLIESTDSMIITIVADKAESVKVKGQAGHLPVPEPSTFEVWEVWETFDKQNQVLKRSYSSELFQFWKAKEREHRVNFISNLNFLSV